MSRTDTHRDLFGRSFFQYIRTLAARILIGIGAAWGVLVLAGPTSAFGQNTCETPGTGVGGAWTDPSVWVDATCGGSSGIPQAGDNVIIRDNDGVGLNSSVTVNNITIEGDLDGSGGAVPGVSSAYFEISSSFFSPATITVTGDITNNGVIVASSALVSFDGTSGPQTVGGTASLNNYELPRIEVNNTDGVTFSQGVTVVGTAQVNSELTLAALSQFDNAVTIDGVLNVASNVRIGDNFFLGSGGSIMATGGPTITFNGGSSQVVDADASVDPIPFSTAITVTNTGGVTFNKAVDLEDDLRINSSLTLVGPLSLAGNFTNNGTFDAVTNDQPVTLDGTTGQTVSGDSDFHDLIIANTSGPVTTGSSAQVLIDNDLTVDPGATFAFNSTEALFVTNNVDVNGTLSLSTNSGGNLIVGGTFDVDAATGTFNPRSRIVTFNGAGTASPQVVSGGPVSFYDLRLVNETTLDLNTTVQVQAALTLGDETGADETLNTNGNLVLLSTSLRDAALLYRGGTVNGTARIQRFLSGSEIGPEYDPVGSAPNPPQIGDDAGWRHMAFPALSGGNPVLASSLVDGTDDEQLIVDVFEGSMIYTWDPTADTWVAGSPSTQLNTGQGAAIFFFDDNVDPILPSGFTVYTEGTIPSSASTTVDLGTTSELYLIGNPYPSFFDLTSIEQGGTSFISTGDFQSTVQIWESSRAEDSAADADDIREPRGGYTPITVDALLTSTSDRVAPWQGFFIERAPSAGAGTVTLDFNTDGTFSDEESDLDFIKSSPAATQDDIARLELELSHPCGEARCVLDRGTQVYFHPEASEAFDRYDASKITMRLEQNAYGVLALVGTKYDELRMKAVESRALPLRAPLALDLDLGIEGMSGQFTIRAATWESVPSDWRVTLVDRATGEEAELTEDGSGYAFTFEGTPKAQTRSALANRQHGVPQPAPVLYEGSAAAKNASGTRFELRIEPTAYIPADLADFSARTQNQSAILTWQTTAETNNAYFLIDQMIDGTFTKIGEEEAAGTPQTYSYTVSDLDVGTHTFRLREVGEDGTEKVIDEIEVRLDLAEEYLLRPAYPNPFTEQATVEFAVKDADPVTVELFNVLGQRVKVLYQGTPTPSEIQRVALDARGLGSGLYVVRMRGEGFSTSETVTLVR